MKKLRTGGRLLDHLGHNEEVARALRRVTQDGCSIAAIGYHIVTLTQCHGMGTGHWSDAAYIDFVKLRDEIQDGTQLSSQLRLIDLVYFQAREGGDFGDSCGIDAHGGGKTVNGLRYGDYAQTQQP